MTKRATFGTGTVRTVRNRAGVVIGYQALLPRHLSNAPPNHPKPESYRQQLGDTYPTPEEAREMLDAALRELAKNPLAKETGDQLACYVDLEIAAREQEAATVYPTAARARRATATWRSAREHWLAKAPFYRWSPTDITNDDVQDWVDTIASATTQRGKRVSGNFVRNLVNLLKASLARAGRKPNPAADLKLPKRARPTVPYWKLIHQRQFFGSDEVEREDRVMVGCGMGLGLRVNELLAQEAEDVHLDGPDPFVEVTYGGPDRSPTKGRQRRRVELFEPALGFWRIWMRDYYRGGRLVFEGPRGGYQKHWPDLFPGWSAASGFDGQTSHVMRHTYAVAMLSGTWGYEPRSMEFVCKQLGHSSIQVTERYYGAFEQGFSRDTVRRMTGRGDAGPRVVVTAEDLLGMRLGGAFGPAGPVSVGNDSQKLASGDVPRHSPPLHEVAENQPDRRPSIGGTRQALEAADACVALLELIAAGAVRADAQTIDALKRAADLARALAESNAEPEANAG